MFRRPPTIGYIYRSLYIKYTPACKAVTPLLPAAIVDGVSASHACADSPSSSCDENARVAVAEILTGQVSIMEHVLPADVPWRRLCPEAIMKGKGRNADERTHQESTRSGDQETSHGQVNSAQAR